jgi:cobalt-factor III methyltransferase
MKGKLNLVSVGPGFTELITPMAQNALLSADAIVGYDFYITWIADLIADKEIFTAPLTKERERALKALELARAGKSVALVSSGDIGVYAMAALAFEEMLESDEFEVTVIPGITAANACASLLGSPLSHDFATLSLSDLLCPWEWIEHRADHIAAADLAVTLYNVQSKKRQDGVYRIIDIMLEHKHPDTVCGVVRNAYRPEQFSKITTLAQLKEMQFDMFTSIVIGNKFTKSKRNWMYTPRGYNSWNIANPNLQANKSAVEIVEIAGPRIIQAESDVLPSNAVWVFSGTSDGNALAQSIADAGYKVVVSAATDYGGTVAAAACPGLAVISGRLGQDNRRQLFLDCAPLAVVDATHPHAQSISQQLIKLTDETGSPYIRFERAELELSKDVEMFDSLTGAVHRAIDVGKRIFLANGSKHLDEVLSSPGAASVQWFIRIAPDFEFLQTAIQLGIPRSNICAMQGPFSRALNEALWRDWAIDCVITKESGQTGGFTEKVAAADALKIPILAVSRPSIAYPRVTSNFVAAVEFINSLGVSK